MMACDGPIPLSAWRPNYALADSFSSPAVNSPHHYPEGDEQKHLVEQMRLNLSFIVAQSLRGHPSKFIAASHGVSREAIDLRLRSVGLKNPPGVRGRPKMPAARHLRPVFRPKSAGGSSSGAYAFALVIFKASYLASTSAGPTQSPPATSRA